MTGGPGDFPREGRMAGSCGAFCAFCGKCGREIPEFMRGNKPENVPPPGEAYAPSGTGTAPAKENPDGKKSLGGAKAEA